MKRKEDFSDTVFSQGLVVWNTNNQAYAIVIDGHRGTENDRSSMVLEIHDEGKLLVHSPPNRALKPTGRVYNLAYLRQVLDQHTC